MAPVSMRRAGLVGAVLSLALWCASAARVTPQDLGAVDGQATTKERLRERGFWPRKTFGDRGSHVGSEACAECHGALVEAYRSTAMARTLAPVTGEHLAALRAAHGAAEGFALGPFRYRISGVDEPPGFTVTDGETSRSAPLEWVFGAGQTGFTWVWREGDGFHESRFSWFPALRRLATTPGRLLDVPLSVDMALGHPLPDAEAEGCFSCHASGIVAGAELDPSRMTPGVTCEGCHGPGADHVALAKSGLGAGAVFDPADLDPDASVDFCGACHSTFWDIALGSSAGLTTLRSPGYRLVRSPCWGDGDARLTCIACHDPHRELPEDPAFYDSACRACHAGADPGADAVHSTAVCPVGTERCASCHMAKYELPEMHVPSTDHWIRIVRQGEPFPE